MTPTHISSHNLLTNNPEKKYFSSARGSLPRRVTTTTRSQSCLFAWLSRNSFLECSTFEPCSATPTWTVGQSPSTRGRVAPGHPREGGGGQERRAPKWAFFHQCYVTWQITPAARQGPVRLGFGGLKGSGQSSPSSCPPPSSSTLQTTMRWMDKKKKKRVEQENTNYNFVCT